MTKTKRGRISQTEDRDIADLLDEGIDISVIAETLNRPVSQIENHVKKFYGKGRNLPAKAPETAEFLRQLRGSSHWRFLKDHYDGDELDYYEELYAKLMAQFKDDILPSEELQILQALDAVILINRHKKMRKNIENQLYELDHKIMVARSGPMDKEDMDNIVVWENQKQALSSQSNSRTKEFTELSKKFDETIGKLKGTREQRIKNIESSKQSWTALIKSMQDRQRREQEGRTMELIKFSTDIAADNLQKPHKYINGETDQPMLVPENILIERHGDVEIAPDIYEETHPVKHGDIYGEDKVIEV